MHQSASVRHTTRNHYFMDTYTHTLRVVNQMEQCWFHKLSLSFGVPLPVPTARPTPAHAKALPVPTMTNGEVQFFSIEYVRPGFNPKDGFFSFDQALANIGEDLAALRDKSVPLIAAVGINYDQCPTPPGFRHNFPTHHLQRKSRHLTWVEDYSSSGMRAALNAALGFYLSNAPRWNANGYASSAVPPPVFAVGGPVPDYILIATNVSPFNSQEAWLNHLPADRAATLARWNPNWHLCYLIGQLGQNIDLWVIHGISAVWPTFIWRNPWIKSWLKTANLSHLTLNSGYFGCKKGLWLKPCLPATSTPVWPWPNCTLLGCGKGVESASPIG